MEEGDGFGTGDGRLEAGLLDQLRQGGDSDVLAVGEIVTDSATFAAFGGDWAKGLDVRTELDIGEDVGAVGVTTGGDGGSIDFGGGDIDGVVLVEEGSSGR